MTTQPFPFDPNILEETGFGRQALFQSFLPTNANPFQQNMFQNLFTPTFNEYLGQIGSAVRQNQAPTTTFLDFLQQSFNPTRQLLRLPTGGNQFPSTTLFRFNR